MLNETQAFNTDISTGDPTIFNPLLTEDLTTLPPPFHIDNPLQGPDFANREDNDFLTYFNVVLDSFKDSIMDDPDADVNLALNRAQFICRATQALAAIIEGICVSFLLTDTLGFLRSLGSDELNHFKVFTAAIASLNQYLSNPFAQNSSH